ncbi:MAG: hypothetical protein NC226_09620 [Bacteroides cellulosilyticus]|nr:hypothetical protein [Bacteroides cellulosilyticus]
MATPIETPQAIEIITRSEIDMQIATAKQYPRRTNNVLQNIVSIATIDEETAEDCFYAVKRGSDMIEGPSVRMSEIFASAWGNLRIGTRIVDNDGKTITAQGICHDLETNVCVQVEVKRRITTKDGNTFSEDMQVVTGNAASAIAFRNAVFKVIPKAITKSAMDQIKRAAIGKANDVERKRTQIIDWFKGRGVTVDEVLKYSEVKNLKDLDLEKVMNLRATANAIKEGTTTVEEAFRNSPTNHVEEHKKNMRDAAKNGTSTAPKMM